MRGKEEEGREDERDREVVGDSRPARGQGGGIEGIWCWCKSLCLGSKEGLGTGIYQHLLPLQVMPLVDRADTSYWPITRPWIRT